MKLGVLILKRSSFRLIEPKQIKNRERISCSQIIFFVFLITIFVAEYKEMKSDMEEKITIQTGKLNTINAGMQNLDSKIDDCVELLSNLDRCYEQMDTATKQHIVGSIFPAKLIFDNKKVRILYVNKVVSLICSNNEAFGSGKTEKHIKFDVLSF